MTDAELKGRIALFLHDWTVTAGDHPDAPTDADWNTYGVLAAHLFRFCRAVRDHQPSPAWDFTDTV